MIGPDAEQTLHNIHNKFSRLTQRVQIVQVEDFPEATQQHVVGVPRTWVRLFWRLANAIVCYHDHHPGPQAWMPSQNFVLIVYFFGGLKPQFCIMIFCTMTTF